MPIIVNLMNGRLFFGYDQDKLTQLSTATVSCPVIAHYFLSSKASVAFKVTSPRLLGSLSHACGYAWGEIHLAEDEQVDDHLIPTFF